MRCGWKFLPASFFPRQKWWCDWLVWFRRSGFRKLGWDPGSFEKGGLLLSKLRGGTVSCEQLDLMGFDFDIFICQIAAGSERQRGALPRV